MAADSGFSSIPMKRRPCLMDSYPSLPMPAKGESTVSPGFDQLSRVRSRSCSEAPGLGRGVGDPDEDGGVAFQGGADGVRLPFLRGQESPPQERTGHYCPVSRGQLSRVRSLLGKNIEHGAECLRLLQDRGAPSMERAEADFQVKRVKAQGDIAKHGERGRGRAIRGYDVTSTRGNKAEYLGRRLRRDRPELFAAFERGDFPTVYAAARAAGIVKSRFVIPRAMQVLLDSAPALRLASGHDETSPLRPEDIGARRTDRAWRSRGCSPATGQRSSGP